MFSTNILTPPSSSDDTESFLRLIPTFEETSPYAYDATMSTSRNDPAPPTGPYLRILEQPVNRFRFRYKSEMAGTHGSLTGMNSDRARKQTYPCVQLVNYDAEAVIRCTLYQDNAYDRDNMPHAHRLVKKVGQEEVDDPHDLVVNAEGKYIANFHSMGIIHTAKKNLVSEVVKKKSMLKKDEIARKEGKFRPLTKTEEVGIKSEAEEESKHMNLNIVCLKFEALQRGANDILFPICPPVFSQSINNLKSAMTGELKIVRMDHCTSSCKGNKEIFMLVEKVTKKNIRIRFFEEDEEGNEIWQADGKFSELDVHHQYAIVFKTPPYKSQTIQSTVNVFVELVRPTDNARSEPKEFRYIPMDTVRIGTKRPRMANESSCSSNLSSISLNLSGDIPTTVSNINNLNISGTVDIDSEDFRKALNDLLPYYTSLEMIERDTPRGFSNISSFSTLTSADMSSQAHRTTSSQHSLRDIDPECQKNCMNALHQLFGLIKSKEKSKERVQKMLKLYFEDISDYNPLHVAVNMGNTMMIKSFARIIKACDEERIFNVTNMAKETPLHLAAEKKDAAIIKLLISAGANPSIQDVNGSTPLYVSVKNQATLPVVAAFFENNAHNFIDIENNDGDTPLNVAIESNPNVVQLLLEKGADVNKIHKKNGFTPLRQAIEKFSPGLVSLLLKQPKLNILQPDFSGIIPIQSAKILRLGNTGIKDIDNIYRMLENYMITHNMPFDDLHIKEEGESSGDEEMDMDHCPEVKSEIFSPEELSHAYEKVKEFTDIGLHRVCAILDASGSWEDLAKLLDLEYLLTTNLFDKDPSRTLLEMAIKVNGDSLFQIRNFLENLDETDAVKIMDTMVMSQ